MSDDRDSTGRRPRQPTHDAHGAESAEARRIEREQVDRALASAAREQFDQLLAGDDTAPDPDHPRPEVHEEITGVAVVQERVRRRVQSTGHAHLADAIAEAIAELLPTLRRAEQRSANRDMAIARIRDGADPAAIYNRIAELEAEIRRRDHAIRNDLTKRIEEVDGELHQHRLDDNTMHTDLVGRDGTNGKVGNLRKSFALWRGIVIGAVSAFLASAGVLTKCVSDHGDVQGSTRTRIEHVEKGLDDVRNQQRSLWQRLFTVPGVPGNNNPGGSP